MFPHPEFQVPIQSTESGYNRWMPMQLYNQTTDMNPANNKSIQYNLPQPLQTGVENTNGVIDGQAQYS